MAACLLDARPTTQGAHVSSASVDRRQLSSAPPTSSSARLAGVCVTGRPNVVAASSGAAAAAAASRQRLRYAAASAAASRQESRRRLAGSPITGAGCVTNAVAASRRTGELRSALQQQAALESPAPARRTTRTTLAHTTPPQTRTSRPLHSITTTKSTSSNTQLAAAASSRRQLAFSRSSATSNHKQPLIRHTLAAVSTTATTSQSPSRASEAATRLPLYLRARQQTLLQSSGASRSQSKSLTASKFSLNSSTSSLTLASVKRARKAPSPAAQLRGAPRRASNSLAELSTGHGQQRDHVQGCGRRAHHRRDSSLAAPTSAANNLAALRRPRSSHRRQSLAVDTRRQQPPVGALNSQPVEQYLHSTPHTSAGTNRAKSAATSIHHPETTTTTATTSCCGSAARQPANGCASGSSGGQPLFCCGESGDSLSLEERLHTYVLQSSQQDKLVEKQQTTTTTTTTGDTRRASLEATQDEPSPHIEGAAMCSDTGKHHHANLRQQTAIANTGSKGKPLALHQEQPQQQTIQQQQQSNQKQATSTKNNNFILSHGLLEQLENQPPSVNVSVDVEPGLQDDADKMSLGSPLVTPPPCDLSQHELPEPQTNTCKLSTQPPPVLAILTNPITDLYDLEPKPFARGKFAQVRRCVHRLTKQCFAAKCIKKRRRSLDTRHEILLEIEALKLSQFTQRIVKLYEVYETSSEMILVLELAKGGELQRVLDEEERIHESSAQQMVAQILDGLIHLHDNDIAHLDIKPQNLLLTDVYPLGDIKLCDFGISRRITKDCEIRDICGTPDYVAPEILRYDPINLSTDMWSLGVLTYILLSGYSPFGSDNKQQTFCNITQAELDFPSEIFDKISADAIDFMKKLIIREPSQRLTSRQARNHVWLSRQKPS